MNEDKVITISEKEFMLKATDAIMTEEKLRTDAMMGVLGIMMVAIISHKLFEQETKENA